MTRTDQAARWVSWCLGATLLGTLPWLVHPWYDPTNDGAMYIATARSIAAGQGYTLLGAPFVIRPPGFPAMVAPLLALFGTNHAILNTFVSLWGVATALLLFHFLRPSTGPWVAAGTALVLWTNPTFQRLCNQTMSDVPGTALVLGTLLLERRLLGTGPIRTSRAFGLGLAIGAAALVRSVALLLAPAMAAARLLRPNREGPLHRELRPIAALALGIALLQGPWSLRNALRAPPPPADQTMLYSYSTGMWHENAGDPDSPRLALQDVLGRCSERGPQIFQTLGTRLAAGSDGLLSGLFAGWLLIGGLVALVVRRGSQDFFSAAVLALLAVYFNFAPRLLLPAFVLLMATTTQGLVHLLRQRSARLAGPVTLAALAALAVEDWAPHRDWPAIRSNHEQLYELAGAFSRSLVPGERVASFRGWHYSVALDRPVYSLQFGFIRDGGPAGAERIIDRYGIRKVILSPVVELERRVVPYFQTRYPNVGTDERALVFRVRQ